MTTLKPYKVDIGEEPSQEIIAFWGLRFSPGNLWEDDKALCSYVQKPWTTWGVTWLGKTGRGGDWMQDSSLSSLLLGLNAVWLCPPLSVWGSLDSHSAGFLHGQCSRAWILVVLAFSMDSWSGPWLPCVLHDSMPESWSPGWWYLWVMRTWKVEPSRAELGSKVSQME